MSHVESRQQPRRDDLQRLFTVYTELLAAQGARETATLSKPPPTTWTERYALYTRMLENLDRIRPYLPGGGAGAYPGNYSYAELEKMREEVGRRAGEYFILRAEALLASAYGGDRSVARRAFFLLGDGLYYLPERAGELSPILDEMKEIGTLHLALRLEGMPELLGFAAARLSRQAFADREWIRYLHPDDPRSPDAIAFLQFDYLDFDGPDEDCAVTDYAEEVLSHYETETYEEWVNDSTAVLRTRQLPIYNTVYATVAECERSFAVDVHGRLTVVAADGRELLARQIWEDADWKNSYCKGWGDARALPPFANSGTDWDPPPEWDLLEDAVDDFLLRCEQLIYSHLP
jgi:hypothetical protein